MTVEEKDYEKEFNEVRLNDYDPYTTQFNKAKNFGWLAIKALKESLRREREVSKNRAALLDQCVTLLSLVRPDIHKETLDRIGLSERDFNSLFSEKKK